MCHNTLMKHAIKPLSECNTVFFMQQNSMHQSAEEAIRADRKSFSTSRNTQNLFTAKHKSLVTRALLKSLKIHGFAFIFTFVRK